MTKKTTTRQTGYQVGQAGIGGACSIPRNFSATGKPTEAEDWGGVEEMTKAFPLQNPPKTRKLERNY